MFELKIAEMTGLKEYNDFSKFGVKDGYMTLTHCGNYDIPVKDLKDPKQALFWIRQLEQKTWMSREELNKFIRIICDMNGV